MWTCDWTGICSLGFFTHFTPALRLSSLLVCRSAECVCGRQGGWQKTVFQTEEVNVAEARRHTARVRARCFRGEAVAEGVVWQTFRDEDVFWNLLHHNRHRSQGHGSSPQPQFVRNGKQPIVGRVYFVWGAVSIARSTVVAGTWVRNGNVAQMFVLTKSWFLLTLTSCLSIFFFLNIWINYSKRKKWKPSTQFEVPNIKDVKIIVSRTGLNRLFPHWRLGVVPMGRRVVGLAL